MLMLPPEVPAPPKAEAEPFVTSTCSTANISRFCDVELRMPSTYIELSEL